MESWLLAWGCLARPWGGASYRLISPWLLLPTRLELQQWVLLRELSHAGGLTAPVLRLLNCKQQSGAGQKSTGSSVRKT